MTATSSDTLKKLGEAQTALASLCPDFPRTVIVLGSGLSDLLRDLVVEREVAFSALPHVKAATVEGHLGRLVIGTLDGIRVACMQGRLHFYEGHTMQEVVFPFRLFARAGAETFLLTNASGGLHREMKPMDLCLIRDHINLMGTNPLVGPNEAELGPRFPDLSHLYDPRLTELVRQAAKELQLGIHEGVYAGISGPCYETPSEIKMYRMLGADCVGMSTVPEAIALHHMGKRVVAVSCITNLAAGVGDAPLDHSEVLENGKLAYTKFSALIRASLKKFAAEEAS